MADGGKGSRSRLQRLETDTLISAQVGAVRLHAPPPTPYRVNRYSRFGPGGHTRLRNCAGAFLLPAKRASCRITREAEGS